MNDATTLEPADDLAKNWFDFCNSDAFEGCDTFGERMQDAGLLYVDNVDDSDLETPFASELGIVPGGTVYRLTDEGQRVLAIQLKKRG